MDDEVAELAVLRRRAYGPDADIDDDPAALTRLGELELRAQSMRARASSLPEPPPPGPPPQLGVETGSDASPAVAIDGDAPEHAAVAAPADDPQRPAPRFRRSAALAAVAGAVAVIAMLQAVAGPTDEPGGRDVPQPRMQPMRVLDALETTLVDIPLDRSLARYVRQPPAPGFPVDGELGWAESLGPYYGWTLWLARSSTAGQRCLLLDRGDRTLARCSSDEVFLAGLLDVSVPYDDVAPEYRPARMDSGHSLVFRWTPERGMSIVLRADVTQPGDSG